MKVDFDPGKITGLTSEEVGKKLISDGYNELPSSKSRNFISIALGVVKEPMFLLLVACGTLYMVLGDVQEGIMLLGFVFVIMGIEFYQEKKTEKALDALRDLASPRALVIRDGVEKRIPGREVVTDDILILHEGDRVPADATVLSSVSLLADESLLTGEPVPVRKQDWDGKTLAAQPGGDDLPFVYSGSMIVQGSGFAKVSATGLNTEIGKIGKAIGNVKEEPTRLKLEMGALVKKLAITGFILCLVVIAVYTLTRGDLLKGFLAGITLAMAMLPEEFPVVLAIFLALGAWRISKKNVLTRKPSAIETLGSATVLCTDKTGTLTLNKMTVNRLFNGSSFFLNVKENELPETFHKVVEYGILASQVNPFDPMEKAITLLGEKYLQGTSHLNHQWEMIREYPLSKELLAMSRVFADRQTGGRSIAAKGAPEVIFDLCHLSDDVRQKYGDAIEDMAKNGLRVLGVAASKINSEALPDNQHDFDFEFLGLIGLSDPIRPEVKSAVAECYRAGIRVIMITGDYPVTAMNIAKEIGLKNPDKAITGAELKTMSEEELCDRIINVNVFARVVPEQKLVIVNALKKNGEVVAMTGDGINDAPALKAAHIGIAMGEKGTDVAREASSLVLMDDNFSSIVAANSMGRRIFDNLQKALAYIFSIHVPIAGLSLIPILLIDLPLILWPIHIVFLELIIDPACSMIFEAEKEEKNVMDRPPRGINEKFFGMNKIFISCMQGVGILAFVMGIYFFSYYSGHTEGQIRAMSFLTLIAANIAFIMSNRSWTRSIFELLTIRNKAAGWVIGGAIMFMILIMNIPFCLQMFQFQKIGIADSLICIAAGLLTITWFEVYKAIKLYRTRKT
ncbi:MAG: cation-translocating P-type ATPase [Bacteroidetes bacterium]|nr:cation-translocating P-type ATPase [Bacteroidota bacterium]